MVKSNHFLFVINNYTSEDLTTICCLVGTHDITYLCYGLEIAPETGTPHIQGYFQANVRKLDKTWNKLLFNNKAYVNAVNGSDEDNVKYCSKTRDGDTPNDIFLEFGERKSIGSKKRSRAEKDDDDFTSIQELLANGGSVRDVMKAFPDKYIKYHAGIEKMAAAYSRKEPKIKHGPWPKDFELPTSFNWETVLIVEGPTNIGKTEWAKTLFQNPFFCSHMDKLRSYDPHFHGGIIFDDIQLLHFPETAQIHIADTDNERDIHVRYGTVHIPAGTKKVFTCNPERPVFADDPAIKRRCTKIILNNK